MNHAPRAARAAAVLAAAVGAACAGKDDGGIVTPSGPQVAWLTLAVAGGVGVLDTLLVGDTVQVSAAAYGADGAPVTPVYTWSSDAPSVGAVLPAGAAARLVAQGAGAATITVTAGGQRASVTLRSAADAPAVLQAVAPPAFLVGQSRTVTVTALGRRGRPVSAAGITVASDDSGKVAVGPVAAGAPAVLQVTGRAAGTTTVRLRAGSAQAAVPVEVVTPALDVDVRELDALPATARGALTEAIRRWQAAFVSYGSPVSVTSPAGFAICGQGTPVGTTESVVGLRLYVRTPDSLPVAGAAAVGGRCIIRGTRTVVGALSIRRDYAASLDSAVLAGIMRHELGHVFGIGSWPTAQTRDVPGPDPRFLGPAAAQAYAAAGGRDAAAGVPLETTGIGPYTHWRQSVFGQETMVAVSARDLPLSAVTLAALGDLGYDVRLSAADPYRVTGAAPASVTSSTNAVALAARTARGAFGAVGAGSAGRVDAVSFEGDVLPTTYWRGADGLLRARMPGY